MKLTGTLIYVRPFESGDAEALLDLELRNQDFFQAYTALRDPDFYTLAGQLDRIVNNNERMALDQYYSFGIFLLETGELIGTVFLSEVVRGPLQSCWIGYYLDQGHNGKGYTTEAVRLAVSYAFDELKLHRIEAGVMPHNLRSMRVLEKAGFHKEGIAKENVKINGKWEDHQILAIVNKNDSNEKNHSR
ncbi:GNAT family N-acetyltransferase [Brevibacillus borstelensis]|uniref:GNAT family N-acetyltransferase n=1 Tax=Brevibacillus borstelensis TaxID=45462 RepID=UPI0030C5DEAE